MSTTTTTTTAVKNEKLSSMDGQLNNFKKMHLKPISGLEWFYLQYILVTGLYMLEPWERKLFNSVLGFFVSLFIASLYYLYH
ncbi:unnamed protein product [Caenorhabditis auriculariae]|uniref:Uncharacterized protein n=1 Tax=Caenorhabditis auriculariae TaxID=2777116 RepID=A0A8S1HE99_9PELO|nr:unnamed protein product [Caenorhabditis auriculariae]